MQIIAGTISTTHSFRQPLAASGPPADEGEAGQSMIEMAFVLPVLLLLITGICTFGLAFNNYILLTEATGTGARQLAISRGEKLDPCATTVSAVYAAAPVLSQANLKFSFNLNGTVVTGTTCNSNSVSTEYAGDLVQGQPVTLTVTYPCSLKVFGSNLAPGCSLTATTTEVVQ